MGVEDVLRGRVEDNFEGVEDIFESKEFEDNFEDVAMARVMNSNKTQEQSG
jgi:hypothetical protein